MEVRAILSVAKGLGWVEFGVLGCEVEVVVAVWVQAVFLGWGVRAILSVAKDFGRLRRGILIGRYAETPSAVADAVPDA